MFPFFPNQTHPRSNPSSQQHFRPQLPSFAFPLLSQPQNFNPMVAVGQFMQPQSFNWALPQQMQFGFNPVWPQGIPFNAVAGLGSVGSIGFSRPMPFRPNLNGPHPTGFQPNQKSFSNNNGTAADVSNGNGNFNMSTNQNFPRSPPGFERRGQCQGQGQGQGQGGFQRQQANHMSKGKGNSRQFTSNRGRGGSQHGQGRDTQPTRSNQHHNQTPRRPLRINYTEQEIHQWREARKKNFPTMTKIQAVNDHKKANEDAVLRRQQLKEILAKQAELGVEVAELPPDYLSGPEGEVGDSRKRQRRNGKFQNKFNKRGKRGRDNHDRRQKPASETAAAAPVSLQREPTLLKKLLNTDIKRDKSKLLQVFRFMTLNSFFKHWPENPLDFPQITAKDDVCHVTSLGVGTSSNVGLSPADLDNPSMEGVADKEEGEDGDGGSSCGDKKSEEGEMTD